MKGYKGFEPGLVCKGKQYAENTVFVEDTAEICKSGMHFCRNPLDVFKYYPPVNDNGELNEFAEVEALDDVKTDNNEKYCTKKLKIGTKINITGLIKAFVEYAKSKIDFDNAAATNTGSYSAATNTGSYSAATNTGDMSAAVVEGKSSFAIATGINGKAKGKKGCYIALAEWRHVKNYDYQLVNFKTHKVDGKKIKENTFYKLKNGKFIEAKNNESI